MARILFVWELGADYGHLSGFTPLARELQSRGHEVISIIKDLSLAHQLLKPENIRFFQAPVWNEAFSTKTRTFTYGELLLELGYKQPEQLCARLAAWQQLYETIQPDLIIADHAPTALLAARQYPFAITLYGTGFFSPPKQHPIPAFADPSEITPQQVKDLEAQAIECINTALNELDAQPIKHLTEIFDADEDFLTTVAELDHYKQRKGQRYWGLRYNLETGVSAPWPNQYKRKIFAYIKSGFPELEKLLQALLITDADIILHSAGLSDILINKYNAKHILFSTQPVNLNTLKTSCDLTICHAGSGTVGGMLLQGVPLLLLPMQAEQLIIAKRTHELGAGEYITPTDPLRNYRKSINNLLMKPSYKQNALAFSKKHQGFSENQQKTAIADRCEEILQLHHE